MWREEKRHQSQGMDTRARCPLAWEEAQLLPSLRHSREGCTPRLGWHRAASLQLHQELQQHPGTVRTHLVSCVNATGKPKNNSQAFPSDAETSAGLRTGRVRGLTLAS